MNSNHNMIQPNLANNPNYFTFHIDPAGNTTTPHTHTDLDNETDADRQTQAQTQTHKSAATTQHETITESSGGMTIEESTKNQSSSLPSSSSSKDLRNSSIHTLLNRLENDWSVLINGLHDIDTQRGIDSYYTLLQSYAYEFSQRSLLGERYAHQLNLIESDITEEGKKIGLFYQQPHSLIKKLQQLQAEGARQKQTEKQH